LVNIENLTGSNYNDTLEGDGGNNKLVGGAGFDTVSYADATSGVTVNLGKTSAQNTIGAGTDTLSGFESLTGSQFNDNLVGSKGNDVLAGLSGNDWLDGAKGADYMIGGQGHDGYVVDNKGDVIDEGTGDGIDSVYSSVSFSLADPLHAIGAIENLSLTGSSNINATGNDLDNTLLGNSKANVIIGGAGADWLDGGGGTDTASYVTSASGVSVSLALGTGSGGDAQGDTLAKIAVRFGVSIWSIVKANNIANPNVIYPGRRLWIPAGTTTGPVQPGRPGCEHLTSPQAGAVLAGIVEARGTADLTNFWYYKLEFRKDGLDEWHYITGSETPVHSGSLGNWDTRPLANGGYTFRLVVVDRTGNYPPACEIPVQVRN
jgi:LysM repeat protein